MKRQVRAGGRRLAERVAPTVLAAVSNVLPLQREVRQLRKRVASLEAEVQENRRLNRRVAELTDIVEELLLPAGDRDEERLRRSLDRYAESV